MPRRIRLQWLQVLGTVRFNTSKCSMTQLCTQRGCGREGEARLEFTAKMESVMLAQGRLLQNKSLVYFSSQNQ